jgi:DNA-binding CsgD family transcriptional regulator
MIVAFSRQQPEPCILERDLVEPRDLFAGEAEFSQELDAIASDCRATAKPIPLAEVWQWLKTGTAKVRASFSTELRYYLVLTNATPGAQDAMGLRHVGCLERLLLGTRQKVTAYDTNRSLSTVSMQAAHCHRTMGNFRPLLQVPVLVIVAAHAYDGGFQSLEARVSRVREGADADLVISMPRLESAVAEKLSPAERSVARMLVEGSSHAKMGEARGRSQRTIANQLGAVFSKLGVSGRMEVVRYLLEASLPDLRDEAPPSVAAAH